MKFKSLIFPSIICVVAAISCSKDYTQKAATSSISPYGQVKIYSATLGALRNSVTINGALLTGSALTYGGTFPANDSYFGVQPTAYGTVVIKDTALVTTQPTLTFPNSFSAGKFSTIFTYDTLTSVKYKVVDDTIVIPVDTTARIRIANFFYSSTAIPAMDVFSTKLKANIFTNVPTASVSGFLTYPSKTSDTLFFRETGTINTVNTLILGTGVIDQKRSYTVVLRGRYASTSGTLVRTTSLVTNY